MALLDRDAWLAKARALQRPRPVELPRLGGEVMVRPLMGDEVETLTAEFDREDVSDREALGWTREWIARLVVTGDGEPFFTGHDDELLRMLTPNDLADVFSAVVGAAGLSSDEEDDEGKA